MRMTATMARMTGEDDNDSKDDDSKDDGNNGEDDNNDRGNDDRGGGGSGGGEIGGEVGGVATGFQPVWYSAVPDCPQKNILSVVPYSTIQLVRNSSKKYLFLQTLECKKCLFSPLKMMAFHYLPPPVEPWCCFPCV